MSTPKTAIPAAQLRETVRNGYAAIATGSSACCCGGACGTSDPALQGEEMADYIVSLSIEATKPR